MPLSTLKRLCLTFPLPTHPLQGFPDSSVGKESSCNAGDPGSIPGSGSSPREGISYPLHYSWASLVAQLVAQLVKNPPVMWETWVQSLGWEDSLEKGVATHSSYSCLENLIDRRTWWATVHGILQARILEWVAAVPFSRESSQPRD